MDDSITRDDARQAARDEPPFGIRNSEISFAPEHHVAGDGDHPVNLAAAQGAAVAFAPRCKRPYPEEPYSRN